MSVMDRKRRFGTALGFYIGIMLTLATLMNGEIDSLSAFHPLCLLSWWPREHPDALF
jgi:hypothetical protein